MEIISAQQLQNQFGQYIVSAQDQPVHIQDHGKTVAVLLSASEYERLDQLEDAYWLYRATEDEAAGFLSATESENLLNEILNAPSESQ